SHCDRARDRVPRQPGSRDGPGDGPSLLRVREPRRHRARAPVAIRAVPPSPRVRLIPRRAIAVAVALVIAGAACLAYSARADSERKAAREIARAPVLATPVWSPRRIPGVFVTATAAEGLRHALPGIVAPYASCVIVDGPDGPVASIGADEQLAGA